MSATEAELRRYGTGRFVPTVVGDPGPVPEDEKPIGLNAVVSLRNPRERTRMPNNGALALDEAVDRAWLALVNEVRATRDVRANLALHAFALALRAFNERPR